MPVDLCRGTTEERIDELIESRKSLAQENGEGGGDIPVIQRRVSAT